MVFSESFCFIMLRLKMKNLKKKSRNFRAFSNVFKNLFVCTFHLKHLSITFRNVKYKILFSSSLMVVVMLMGRTKLSVVSMFVVSMLGKRSCQ